MSGDASTHQGELPRRQYDSTRRKAAAVETRRKIVEAATDAFLRKGYVGATIPQIAASAGVAVETVYRSASGKAGLLAYAVQSALAGGPDRADQPVESRAGIRRVIEEADPRRRLALYAATQPGVWSRVGPLLRVLETAAAGGDEALVELSERLNSQRLDGLRGFATLLHDRGELQEGLTIDRARDLIWTLCAQANYEALVVQRGWTHQEYRDWLTEMLCAALLPGIVS